MAARHHHYRWVGPYERSAPDLPAPDDFPWVAQLEALTPIVREEVDAHLADGGWGFRPSFHTDDVAIEGWTGINLFTYLWPRHPGWEELPRSVAALREVPGIVCAFVNVLEPGASLPPHYGETDAVHRAHLGLVVPGGVDECGIEVGDSRAGWSEGKVLVINDAQRHSVWNHTDRPRVILVCDLVRAEHVGAEIQVCAHAIVSTVLTFTAERVPLLRRLPRSVRRVLLELGSVPVAVVLWLGGAQRRRVGSARTCVR